MSRLWVVTSFFNPAGYRRKLSNYRVFRQRLEAPLLAVELSHGAPFELGPGDADRLIQLRGGDVMWQKERLLNIAIAHLPEDCEYVAWVDCDIVFDRTDWAAAAISELGRTSLCQLYGAVHHLRRDTPFEAIGRDAADLTQHSMGYALAHGLPTSIAAVTDQVHGAYKRGHAWSARRDLLAEDGLYDRNILGSGDMMIAFAVTGHWEAVIADRRMLPGHAGDYRAWASRFRSKVDRISYIEGDIFHLWHGNLKHRRYSERQQILSSHGYDPATDIAVDEQGCWRWSSAKPELHWRVREYFEERDEDGTNSAEGRPSVRDPA